MAQVGECNMRIAPSNIEGHQCKEMELDRVRRGKRVSELIQKLLDIGGCGAETEWARGYDDGVNNAINVVEEYLQQPTLNENQQIVLDYLKRQAQTGKPLQVIFWMMNTVAWDKLDELRNPIMHLTNKEQAQVLQAFSQWVLEQEEE